MTPFFISPSPFGLLSLSSLINTQKEARLIDYEYIEHHMELTCIDWRFYAALSLLYFCHLKEYSYYNKIQNQSVWWWEIEQAPKIWGLLDL